MRPASDSLELTMTPMIDVVFLLLVFFVWTSSFELPEFDLPSAIAQPPAGGNEIGSQQPLPAEAFDELFVGVSLQDARQVITLNGQRVDSLAALSARLKEILALGVQPPVIVDPSEQITMNVAVSVYDAARAAGADRVLFAARSE
jgi:biopolymer transport protein ExbD